MKIFYIFVCLVLIALSPFLFCADTFSVKFILPDGSHQSCMMLMNKHHTIKSSSPSTSGAPGGPDFCRGGYQREGLPRSFSFPDVRAVKTLHMPKVQTASNYRRAFGALLVVYTCYTAYEYLANKDLKEDKIS